MLRIWQDLKARIRPSFTIAAVRNEYVSVNWKRPRTFSGPATLDLRDAVVRALDDGQRLFLIDLRRARYVNSWGHSTLYGIVLRILETGGQVVLLSKKNDVFEALTLPGYGDVFTVETELDGALDRLLLSRR